MRRALVLVLLVLVAAGLIVAVLWWKGRSGRRAAEDAAGRARRPASVKPIVTSEDLIAKALAAGEIDYETSLRYRVYALFGDPRLPQKYVSDVINLDAGTALFAEIIANQGKLSPATQRALAPYLLRPNDSGSIFNHPRAASEGFHLVSTAEAAGTWTSRPAAGGLVRVWTRSSYNLGTLAGYVDQVWPKLRTLIRAPTPDQGGVPSLDVNPDSAIDVYFLSIGDINPRYASCSQNPRSPSCTFADAAGWTQPASPYSGQTSSAAVIIDGDMQGDFLVGTIAHELFHASQDTYSYMQKWLAEATATWAEFRVLQQLGRSPDISHRHLPAFFSDLDVIPLDLVGGGDHEYGAYLYFFFAQMEQSDGVVAKVWESAATKNEAEAVDAAFPFKDHFRDFALRNWNFDPVPKQYSTMDSTFPDLGPPMAGQLVLHPDHTETLDKDVSRLAARYYSADVSDSGIKKVLVHLGGVAESPDAGVDALVTIEGKKAEVRHWTGQTEGSFCLDDPDERLRSLVLIVSNSNMKDDLHGKIEIEPSSKPCPEWTGSVTLERHAQSSDTGNLTLSENFQANVELEFDPKSGHFAASSASGSFKVDHDYVLQMPGCVMRQQFTGAGRLAAVDRPPHNVVPGEGQISVNLWANPDDTYELNVGMLLLPPSQGEMQQCGEAMALPEHWDTMGLDCRQAASSGNSWDFKGKIQNGQVKGSGSFPDAVRCAADAANYDRPNGNVSLTFNLTRHKKSGK